MSKAKKRDNRRESFKKNKDFDAQNRRNRIAGLSFIRELKRNDHLSNKRGWNFDFDTMDRQQGIVPVLDLNEENVFLTSNQTVGHVRCSQCGTQIYPNKANMCWFCQRTESNVSGALPTRVNITHCPDCGSYLQPPSTWIKAERDSKKLLSFCLKRLTKLPEDRLVDANFLPTDPNSKRIKLRLIFQLEERSHEVEYVVRYQKCRSCQPADPSQWDVVVQVRQHVSHMRTFLFLEQLIIKHNAAQHTIKIKQVKEGVNFYFGNKMDAGKFYFFLSSVVPIQPRKFLKQVKSRDMKNNISCYELSICATISPICHDDLVYLPPKLSAQFGHLGPLVVCTKVSNNITFLDPLSLQTCIMSAEVYWREPFEPLLSCKQLVEYIVLDVEVETSELESRWLGGQKYADVQIARVSDFGKNDKISSVRTHIGHILKPGDFALGYDLSVSTFNDDEAEKKGMSLPDIILIKKTYREGCKVSPEVSSQKKEDSEYEQFKRDLLANPELRFNISLDEERGSSQTASSAASVLDEVPLSKLEDIFADLGLSDEEGGCLKDTDTN